MKLTLLLLALLALLVCAVPQANLANTNAPSTCNICDDTAEASPECRCEISDQGDTDYEPLSPGHEDIKEEKDTWGTVKIIIGLYATALFVYCLI
ncbi:hypothetical protein P171DRAFT_488522 [Karstenula rhodostoma CBS 690.94]|uniref:Uncharacterized protein n=1 Tax=Karstenula rhodostoma CBS 690.94 TaxID=1392251 RepID=A0A9P4PBI7_9PLEO|nr:hypothetical protein P171DRAFT_488522 [Karstenula rhodostoma CBS 690.94]